MPRSASLLSLLALLAFAGLAPAPDRARAGEDADALAWRRTYEDALREARIRGVPVLVTRHKDE